MAHLNQSRESSGTDDPLGLAAWSASRGLSVEAGLALVAAVLSNIAGPLQFFDCPSPFMGSPGLGIAASTGDAFGTAAVAELTLAVRAKQDGLVLRSREFTREELEVAYHDGGFLKRNQEFLVALGNLPPTEAARLELTPDEMLARDTRFITQTVQLENVTRPRILLPVSLPADIDRVIGECHLGHGFAAGSIEALPTSGTKRHDRVDELLRYVIGVESTNKSGGRSVAVPEPRWLRGILCFSLQHFDWLIHERRDLLAHLIPLIPSEAPIATIDEEAAAHFGGIFGRASVLALTRRRAHVRVEGHFTNTSAAWEFIARQREFVGEVQRVPGEQQIPAIAALPAAIAWTLLVLAGRTDVDDYVLRVAFDAARKIHHRAIQTFQLADNAALASARLHMARKLVTRLTRFGRCKRRELVRGFAKQGLDLHEPVIRILIEARVLIETDDAFLSLGPVPVENLAASNLLPLVFP